MADRYTYLPSLVRSWRLDVRLHGMAKVDLMKQRRSSIKILVAVMSLFLFTACHI